MAKDWIQQMKDTVQPHVPEPVIAVGMLQPAGTWGAFGIGRMSPLAGRIMDAKNNQKAGGLAKQGIVKFRQALIAVTADKAYAFNSKVKGRGYKVTDQVGVWDRKDLVVTTEPGKMTTKVTIDVKSTGDHYELEATTISTARDIAVAFLDEFAKPV